MIPTTMQLVSMAQTAFSTFIHSNPLQQFGLLGVFIVGIIPSFVIFVPDESVLIPVYLSNPISDQVHKMILIYGFGIFLSGTMIFFASHHLTNLLRKEHKEAVEAKHFLYKYRMPVFIIAPSLLFGVGDAIVIWAGIRHLHYLGILPYLILGSFIRAIWGVLIVIFVPHLIGLS